MSMTKAKNPIKVMMIITIILVVSLIVITLFKKDKVYLEDENGSTITGASGKFLDPEPEA